MDEVKDPVALDDHLSRFPELPHFLDKIVDI